MSRHAKCGQEFYHYLPEPDWRDELARDPEGRRWNDERTQEAVQQQEQETDHDQR